MHLEHLRLAILDSKNPVGIGHINDRGNACLEFHLCGVKHPLPGPKFEGIIDTGFTGFVQLPLVHAISLQLPLEGTNTVTLADASTVDMLTALGQATLLNRTEIGVVLLSTSSNSILIGMDFLRRFERTLVVSTGVGVALFDEAWIKAKVAEDIEDPSK